MPRINAFELTEGHRPLLVSTPHVGTQVPEDIARRFTPEAMALEDTDWHVDRLYDFARELGAWTVRPLYSRYVADLNRPPDGALLYPGKRETTVCPSTTFGGAPLYIDDQSPNDAEVNARIDTYWRPYHRALQTTLDTLLRRFDYALLWDAHSIRSECPLLFEGRLPDFNLGIGEGTCPAEVAEQLLGVCSEESTGGAVLNGRFKGGYITRHYGAPQRKVWAVQLELSQLTYLNEEQPAFGLTPQADVTRKTLRRLLTTYLEAGEERARR